MKKLDWKKYFLSLKKKIQGKKSPKKFVYIKILREFLYWKEKPFVGNFIKIWNYLFRKNSKGWGGKANSQLYEKKSFIFFGEG